MSTGIRIVGLLFVLLLILVPAQPQQAGATKRPVPPHGSYNCEDFPSENTCHGMATIDSGSDDVPIQGVSSQIQLVEPFCATTQSTICDGSISNVIRLEDNGSYGLKWIEAGYREYRDKKNNRFTYYWAEYNNGTYSTHNVGIVATKDHSINVSIFVRPTKICGIRTPFSQYVVTIGGGTFFSELFTNTQRENYNGFSARYALIGQQVIGTWGRGSNLVLFAQNKIKWSYAQSYQHWEPTMVVRSGLYADASKYPTLYWINVSPEGGTFSVGLGAPTFSW